MAVAKPQIDLSNTVKATYIYTRLARARQQSLRRAAAILGMQTLRVAPTARVMHKATKHHKVRG